MTREELLKLEYYGRVERAVDYLYAHYSEDIGLADLADVAGFSRFHFHRIFSGIVGETVGEFLKRIRLQNAASRDWEAAAARVQSEGEPVTEARRREKAFGA